MIDIEDIKEGLVNTEVANVILRAKHTLKEYSGESNYVSFMFEHNGWFMQAFVDRETQDVFLGSLMEEKRFLIGNCSED